MSSDSSRPRRQGESLQRPAFTVGPYSGVKMTFSGVRRIIDAVHDDVSACKGKERLM